MTAQCHLPRGSSAGCCAPSPCPAPRPHSWLCRAVLCRTLRCTQVIIVVAMTAASSVLASLNRKNALKQKWE